MMDYFQPEEFTRAGEDWFFLLSSELKIKLDLFRHRIGPVVISGSKHAVGRRDDSNSQHNVNKWGEVRAVDVMPKAITGKATMINAIEIAKQCGFKGIGVYPHWKPRCGLHLDVRKNISLLETPAMWGAVSKDGKQVYVTVDEALKAFD